MNAPSVPPDQAAALAKLRGILKPGDTVHAVMRHTSRSGASRSVSLFGPDLTPLDELAAPALGEQLDRKHGGIRTYAPDAGESLTQALSAVLGIPLQHRRL